MNMNVVVVSEADRLAELNARNDPFRLTLLITSIICQWGPEYTRNLLAQGADPLLTDIYGNNALHWAAKENRKEWVPMLLGTAMPLDTLSTFGQSALWYACCKGFHGMAVLLVEGGADTEKTGAGMLTPMGIAKANGHAALAKYMLYESPRVRAQNWRRRRAFAFVLSSIKTVDSSDKKMRVLQSKDMAYTISSFL